MWLKISHRKTHLEDQNVEGESTVFSQQVSGILLVGNVGEWSRPLASI